MIILLKVYIKGGLFERLRELLFEFEFVGYVENEVKFYVYIIEKSNLKFINLVVIV